MHTDEKISGARIRTHDLWIRKRVCYPLHHSAAQYIEYRVSSIEYRVSNRSPTASRVGLWRTHAWPRQCRRTRFVTQRAFGRWTEPYAVWVRDLRYIRGKCLNNNNAVANEISCTINSSYIIRNIVRIVSNIIIRQHDRKWHYLCSKEKSIFYLSSRCLLLTAVLTKFGVFEDLTLSTCQLQ